MASFTALIGACSPSEGGSGGSGASTGQNQPQGSGPSTASFGVAGSTNTGQACVATSAKADNVSKPVDIVFVIDNSGSMSEEIEEVEAQINKNFAGIVDSANPPIDYRVVMVSAFGASADRQICVSAPLGGIPDADGDGHCDSIPNAPVNSAKFFHHSAVVNSHNALCQLHQQFSEADEFGLQTMGYGQVLRPDAFKFLVVISDDRPSDDNGDCGGPAFDDNNSIAGGQSMADEFDAALFTLSPEHFGDAASRNYRFWSIIALEPHNPSGANPYGEPHPPDEAVAPVTLGECTPSAVNPGTGYQALSILTGGYRFPTCGLDYTAMFTLMAQGVIAGALVPCTYKIPDPPAGEMIDRSTIQVVFTSGAGVETTFTQVPTAAACTPSSFYLDGDNVVLCPDACTAVTADNMALIDIRYGCSVAPS